MSVGGRYLLLVVGLTVIFSFIFKAAFEGNWQDAKLGGSILFIIFMQAEHFLK